MSDEKTNAYAFNELAPNYNISFHNGKKEVGRLDFNGPKPVFIGDMEESAEIFLRLLCDQFQGRLDKEREPLERENAALRRHADNMALAIECAEGFEARDLDFAFDYRQWQGAGPQP